jgi:hypothetical protein
MFCTFHVKLTFGEVNVGARRGPKNLRITCDHRGLTHFGGIHFFQEFLQVLQVRRFLTQNLDYPRRNQRYSLAQMILALVYPLILGWIDWRPRHSYVPTEHFNTLPGCLVSRIRKLCGISCSTLPIRFGASYIA